MSGSVKKPPVRGSSALRNLSKALASNCAVKLEGASLVPQMRDPFAPRDPVVSTFFVNNHAVHSRDYRYIHYSNGDDELYDHRSDPNEWRNLAKQPEMESVIREHAQFLPKVNVPPLKGSMGMGVDPAHRDWFGGVQ